MATVRRAFTMPFRIREGYSGGSDLKQTVPS
jgi:hypothetical protein